jgi:hypothetical protein
MDAPFNEAFKIAKSILSGDCVFISTECRYQTLIFIRNQVNRLWMKPGDPVPLGLTERQRYEYLMLLLNAIATAQQKKTLTDNQ